MNQIMLTDLEQGMLLKGKDKAIAFLN